MKWFKGYRWRKNGGKRGQTEKKREETGKNLGGWIILMNRTLCLGLLHCHCFFVRIPLLMLLSSQHRIFILMKVYCMCAYNIWCQKNGPHCRTSPRPSHVLAHHPNRLLPLVLRAMHGMENGFLPRLLPNVSDLRTKMHVRAQ